MTGYQEPRACLHRRFATIVLPLLMLGCLGLAGCSFFKRGEPEVERSSVEVLYQNARKSLDSSDFVNAVRLYEALTARFPFSDQARQARLDLIYTYYRQDDDESALDAAKQFILENPTHSRVDYAWYMQGLVQFERIPYRVERWFGVDMSRRPPKDVQSAITAFNTVVREYPQSRYAADAQKRAWYLRNRLAEYEVRVARYYIKRGAWLAAAQRAQRAIEQYDGAPAMREALEVMITSYDQLGFTDLKSNIERVYAANFTDAKPESARARKWWFW